MESKLPLAAVVSGCRSPRPAAASTHTLEHSRHTLWPHRRLPLAGLITESGILYMTTFWSFFPSPVMKQVRDNVSRV